MGLSICDPGRNKDRQIDNAFFLLLGSCLGAYLIATGGIMTYVAFFRDPPIDYDNLGFNVLPNHVTGPLLVGLGSLIIMTLVALGCIYGCNTVPEFIKKRRSATEYKNLIGEEEGQSV